MVFRFDFAAKVGCKNGFPAIMQTTCAIGILVIYNIECASAVSKSA